jgi:hypothetical protein
MRQGKESVVRKDGVIVSEQKLIKERRHDFDNNGDHYWSGLFRLLTPSHTDYPLTGSANLPKMPDGFEVRTPPIEGVPAAYNTANLERSHLAAVTSFALQERNDQTSAKATPGARKHEILKSDQISIGQPAIPDDHGTAALRPGTTISSILNQG